MIDSRLTVRLQKRLRHFSIDVNLELGQETLVLVGMSGCGKTTTLRMLAGLIGPDRGFIRFQEQTWVDTEQKVRPLDPEHRGVGYVVQNYALFPHLSVSKNIAYGLRRTPRAQRAQRITDVMGMLGISELSGSMPGALSGGEQQRVAMARALVVRPQLMLLDEPLAALDASIRARLRGELRATLRRFAIPAVIVTHDLEDALILGDRLGVMDRGKIVQLGTADDLAQYPATPFVASFVGTNLVKVAGRAEWVCFDPWNVSLTANPISAKYEWDGVIVAVSRQGAAQRLTIRTDDGGHVLADVDLRNPSEPRWEAGDRAYARVSEEFIRVSK